VVLEQIVAHQANLVPPHVSILLLHFRLKIVVPFWAISSAPAHLISFLVLERFLVLHWIEETLICPFVSTIDVVVFATIMLHVEG
jgi:hypothetical protein